MIEPGKSGGVASVFTQLSWILNKYILLRKCPDVFSGGGVPICTGGVGITF
jgi:hypothetical protein